MKKISEGFIISVNALEVYIFVYCVAYFAVGTVMIETNTYICKLPAKNSHQLIIM